MFPVVVISRSFLNLGLTSVASGTNVTSVSHLNVGSSRGLSVVLSPVPSAWSFVF